MCFRPSKEAPILGVDGVIALARVSFQRGTVEDHDHAAAVRDPPHDFQLLRGKRHTFAANTDHVGDQLLSHAQDIVIDSI